MDLHRLTGTAIQMVYELVPLESPGSDGTLCHTKADACSFLVVKSGDLTRSKKTSAGLAKLTGCRETAPV